MSTIRTRVIAEITKPTERDGQKRVGPSELGNSCAKCLARALMDERPEQDFSLYPWLGTGVHYFMEHKTFPDAQHELKLHVGDVPGYGPIKGTSDMYDPEEKAVVDWKIVGLKKLKSYRVNGVSTQYRYQAQLYGAGCVRIGLPVDKVAICFIPRDSGNVRDIWVYEEAFQQEMADAALDRAGELWKWLQEPGNHWSQLASDTDCFQCNHNW